MAQKCRYPCSLVSGTVFEARKLPLPTGFLAMHWLHIPRRTSRRCWRLQLKRHLGVSYATPGCSIARFKTTFDESVPCLTNGLGSKGVGELGTIGATPAVLNAVVDALAHAGLGRETERVQMPLTSEVVWRALRGDFGPVRRVP